MSKMPPKVKSPERLYLTAPFDFGNENVVKHLARYNFASQFTYGQIFDCACGSGYGSKILSKTGDVLGIDSCQEALDFANYYNKPNNVVYLKKDIEEFNTEAKYDSIVCIETFEHISKSNSVDMLFDFDYMLKKDGILFLTTPMLRYKENKPYITNPYHVNEMPKNDLITTFNLILPNYLKNYFHQEISRFMPLVEENTGFLIMVARKL